MRNRLTGLTALMAALLVGAAPVRGQEPVVEPGDSTQDVVRPGPMHPGMMQPQMMGMMGAGGMGMMQGMVGQGGMMGMMGGGMMGMAGGPAMILRLEESLGLTDDQVGRLEALRETTRTAAHEHMMQAMQAMQAAQEVLASESSDLDSYEARLREAADHMVLAHTTMAGASLEARSVLTPDQRERLSLARRMMDELRGSMMGEPMSPWMMQDGGNPGGGTGGAPGAGH